MTNHILAGQPGIFGKIVIHSNIFNGFLIPLKKSIFQKVQYFGVDGVVDHFQDPL